MFLQRYIIFLSRHNSRGPQPAAMSVLKTPPDTKKQPFLSLKNKPSYHSRTFDSRSGMKGITIRKRQGRM